MAGDAYWREGVATFRASALGSCWRALVASLMGERPLPPPDRLQTIFDEGNLHEPAVIEKLKADGALVEGEQDVVELAFGKAVLVRGHIDGRIVWQDHFGDRTERVLEIKALGRDSFETFRRFGLREFPRYAWQISVYMHGLGIPGVFVVKNRNSGNLHVCPVDEPPMSIEEIRRRCFKVLVEAKRGQLPECDVSNRFGCPFFHLHDDAPIASAGPEPSTAPERLVAMVTQYGEYLNQRDDLDAAMKVLRDRIVDEMGEGKLRCGEWNASVSMRKQRRVDMKKLRSDMGEEMARYEYETISPQLRLTKST